jgi:glycosyltransferase involved in cell wall biosynthesis
MQIERPFAICASRARPYRWGVRVLEVVQGLGQGGAERALLQRLRHAPADVESTVVNLRPELDAMFEMEVKTETFSGSWWAQRRFLQNIVRDKVADVIVVRTPRDLLNVASWRLKKRQTARIFYEAHSEVASERSGLTAGVIAFLVGVANRRVDHHIAVSRRVAAGELCRRANRVTVHYMGAEVDNNAEPQLSKVRGTRFVSIGRLVRLKRPVWLIERVRDVAGEFRTSGSKFAIVGEGPLRADAERAVKDWALEDVIEVIGPVVSPDGVLAASDVLVVASTSEGLPLTVFEAKQFGLRVLTTPAGGTSEIVGEEDRVTDDFASESFNNALRSEIHRGQQSIEDRKRVARANQEYSARITAQGFYRILRGL